MVDHGGVTQRPVDPHLADHFRNHREILAAELFGTIRENDAIAPEITRRFSDLDDWSRQTVFTAIDLAIY